MSETKETKPKKISAPIWHRPKWITAIIGLIGILITVPGELASYLETREQTKQKRQERILGLVETALTSNGDDRVFWLRYVSSTFNNSDLNAEEVREWATQEVSRLDKISELEASKQALTAQVEELASIAELNKEQKAEIERNKREIADYQKQINELRAKAGSSVTRESIAFSHTRPFTDFLYILGFNQTDYRNLDGPEEIDVTLYYEGNNLANTNPRRIKTKFTRRWADRDTFFGSEIQVTFLLPQPDRLSRVVFSVPSARLLQKPSGAQSSAPFTIFIGSGLPKKPYPEHNFSCRLSSDQAKSAYSEFECLRRV